MEDSGIKIIWDTEIRGTQEVNKSLQGVDNAAIATGKNFDELGRTMTKSMKTAIEETEAAKNSVFSFSNILSGIGKTAVGAIGLVTAALKPVADFDNYIGSLNKKITQVGGQLNNYKNIALEFRKADFFKAGEGGFGLSEDDLNKVEYSFAAGTTAFEKFGAKSKENIKGFAQGAGMAMKTIGGTADQASAAMVDLHKTIGVSFKEEEMTPFVTTMANISKSANMTDTQFYSLTKQVTGLAKAYGLSGEAGKQFVTNSLSVGAALSQVGLDASDMMSKMNAIASGSEQGLITSLILGFKKDDPIGQLKAFQRQAKIFVDMTKGMGNAAPMMLQSMTSAYGMNTTNEQTQRLAMGGPMEEPGGKGKDVTSILGNILDTLKDPDKSPWVTAAQTANNAIVGLKGMAEDKFWPELQAIKGAMTANAPALIKGLGDKLDTLITLLGGGMQGFLLAAGALAAIPTAITLGFGLLAKAFVTKGAVGGAAELAAGVVSKGAAAEMLFGSSGLLVAGTASIAAIVGGVLLAAGVGYAVGTLINKHLSEKTKNEFGDFLKYGFGPWAAKRKWEAEHGDSDSELRKNDTIARGLQDSGQTLGNKGSIGNQFASGHTAISPTGYASSHAGVAVLAPSSKKTVLSVADVQGMTRTAAKQAGLTSEQEEVFFGIINKESGFRQDVKKGTSGEIGVGQLMPANVKKFGVIDPTDVKQNLAGAVKLFKTEVDRYPNDLPKAVAAYNTGDKNVDAGKIPSSTKQYVADVMGGTGLTKVHDENAISLLAQIRDLLSNGSASITSNPSASPLINQALGNFGAPG
jgi:hypothetical protein